MKMHWSRQPVGIRAALIMAVTSLICVFLSTHFQKSSATQNSNLHQSIKNSDRGVIINAQGTGNVVNIGNVQTYVVPQTNIIYAPSTDINQRLAILPSTEATFVPSIDRRNEMPPSIGLVLWADSIYPLGILDIGIVGPLTNFGAVSDEQTVGFSRVLDEQGKRIEFPLVLQPGIKQTIRILLPLFLTNSANAFGRIIMYFHANVHPLTGDFWLKSDGDNGDYRLALSIDGKVRQCGRHSAFNGQSNYVSFLQTIKKPPHVSLSLE